jgi:alkanesulfonate monooxygenase SsuD/methylene tetrahydromethanopterin reductase-like flavin-dependent oxidoreductase (luciferase family)
MTEFGIMLEGQEGLTWERFFRLADAVEEAGLDHLFRSDHLVSFGLGSKAPTLALWPSLTALAMRTKRIRFGPLVCSITFRHPAMIAKMAAAVSNLSNGRFDMGLGAGWFKGEHEMFGIDFPKYSTRLEMLDEGAEVIKALWAGHPVTMTGKYYSLDSAENHPIPPEESPAFIIGGKGEKTLKVVAKHATEWNFTYDKREVFKEKSAELDRNCEEIGRDPATMRRSLMIPFVIGWDDSAVQERIDGQRQMFPWLPDNIGDWQAEGFIGGTPQAVMDQLGAFVEAGVERFMLQHNDLDNVDSVALLGETVGG